MDSTDPSKHSREYHTTYERDRSISLRDTIVEAVATVTDVEPADLDSLQTAVNLDALEQLMLSLEQPASHEWESRIEFTFEGCRVEVTSSGEIAVRRLPDSGTRDAVSTEAAFQADLAQLIREAEANGVAVEGGWVCRDESVFPTWGIEIYEVDESQRRQ